MKNLKTKCDVQVQYLWCNNAKKYVYFKCVCKQEEIGIEVRILPQVPPSIMAFLNENFLPSPKEYMPVSMVRNVLPFLVVAYKLKQPILPPFWKAISAFPIDI